MISVIVPIYKVESYLSRCIDSVLAQTCQDFELILVDDGSPDGCGAVCDAYAAGDSRITVIHKENGGLSDARNAGLLAARGEYIAFVDSDDWLMPNYLRYMLDTLRERGADICECGILRTDGTESAPEETLSKVQCFEAQHAMGLLIEDKVLHQYVWNKLYRREVIGDITFPKGKTNEDEFWTYQVFGNAKLVAKIDTPLYMYFQRRDSIMGEGYSLKRLDALEAKEARQLYIEENYPQLAVQARANMWLSCLYAAQMSMKYLSEADFEIAKKKIDHYLGEISIDYCMLCVLPKGPAVWAIMSRLGFWGVCRLRNILRRGL